MIPSEIAEKVLTIGPLYKGNPKGGMGIVMKNIDTYAYGGNMRSIVNSSFAFGKLKQIIVFIWAILCSVFILVFNRKIKIVHIHTSSKISFVRSSIFVCIAKLLGRKVLLHIHSGAFKDYYNSKPKYVGNILAKCDCIVALSENWKHVFVDELKVSIPVRVVKNMIEPPVFMPALDGDDVGLRIIYLGHITHDKGALDLVKAISFIHDEMRRYKVRLHICGIGYDMERMQELIAKDNLSDVIVVEGWVSGERKIQLMNSCQIDILPSYYEGLPMSILEAMSYGMAVIATPVGAIPSVVMQGLTGFLQDAGDIHALALNIKKLIEDRQLLRSMGRAATAVAADYLPERVIYQLTAVYQELLFE